MISQEYEDESSVYDSEYSEERDHEDDMVLAELNSETSLEAIHRELIAHTMPQIDEDITIDDAANELIERISRYGPNSIHRPFFECM
jgi:hypothetical protein